MSADLPDETAERPRAGERGPGYRQITQALIADVKAGTWDLGGQLPTEGELVERFGASRSTVRESLRELESYGYIRRRRGTRSILVSTDPADRFVNSVQSIEELLQYSRHTRSRLLSTDLLVADEALAERLGVAEGSHWLRAQILRMPLRGALPLGFSEIFVDGRYARVARRLDEGETIYRLLEAEFGMSFRRVEQTVEATAASPALALMLQVAEASPLLTTRTEFVTGAGEVVEIGFGHFPASRFRLEILLERGPGSSDRIEP